jgi:hypothetical protein
MRPVYKRTRNYAAIQKKENINKPVLEKVHCLVSSVLSGVLMEATSFCK